MAQPTPAETFSLAEIQSALDTGEDPLDLKTEAGHAMLATVQAAIRLRDSAEGTARSGAWLDFLATLNAFEP